MLIVIPFSHRDYAKAQELLRWMSELDGAIPNHKALLVASSQVPDSEIKAALNLASKLFGRATAIKQRRVEERGWPYSPNAMFRLAAETVKRDFGCPFLWLEPDATPLQSGCLTSIEREYQRVGKPFMGFIYPWINATKKRPHLTGVAVYPADIAKYNPHVLRATSEPWDVTRPELTLPHTHESKLIYHDWAKRDPQTCHEFRTQDDVRRIIPKSAVIFHSNKNGDLITRLRERRNQVSVHYSLTDLLLKVSRREVRALLRGGSSYYHSGNLGDIAYALYAIKLHGGGDLVIGPKQNRTSPCSVPVSRGQFDLAAPLFGAQSYIHKLEFSESHPGAAVKYDLNTFRDNWDNWRLRQDTGIHNLCEMHCYTLGVRHLMQQDEPWIECGEPIWTGKIIVHRSARYRANNFPWKQLVERHRRDILFVGLEEEHKEFERSFGKVNFWRVVDFLELARVISGGVAFVGNQSFPCALALAMGQRVWQESWPKGEDCVFQRDGFMNQRQTVEEFERWLV